MAEPGEGRGGPGPPLFLDQTEAEIIFLQTGPPLPPHLKVWIWQWFDQLKIVCFTS